MDLGLPLLVERETNPLYVNLKHLILKRLPSSKNIRAKRNCLQAVSSHFVIQYGPWNENNIYPDHKELLITIKTHL